MWLSAAISDNPDLEIQDIATPRPFTGGDHCLPVVCVGWGGEARKQSIMKISSVSATGCQSRDGLSIVYYLGSGDWDSGSCFVTR